MVNQVTATVEAFSGRGVFQSLNNVKFVITVPYVMAAICELVR
jgi:hypothetical protein